ncbi:hypothetical protein [Dyella sp. ASV21]|jgi:hypothetical protein|uniref:hypothetical protein n=1 Tax=Dyella sp. ASV21 TaxID=2795114 RepID=UPI0018ED4459|nr:hypothetical protein [Dyella sp. ASV21]
MRLVRLLPLLLSTALALPSIAFAAEQYVPLQQRMSPEDFKAAGLDKLSPDELKNLDAWLSGHGKTVTKMVDASGNPVFYTGKEKVGPIQARVQGSFAGFNGHSEFTLDNGQMWKQADTTSISCLAADSPKVTIRRSLLGNWMMAVDGCSTTTAVVRTR